MYYFLFQIVFSYNRFGRIFTDLHSEKLNKLQGFQITAFIIQEDLLQRTFL